MLFPSITTEDLHKALATIDDDKISFQRLVVPVRVFDVDQFMNSKYHIWPSAEVLPLGSVVLDVYFRSRGSKNERIDLIVTKGREAISKVAKEKFEPCPDNLDIYYLAPETYVEEKGPIVSVHNWMTVVTVQK